jgi:hypothetical protein
VVAPVLGQTPPIEPRTAQPAVILLSTVYRTSLLDRRPAAGDLGGNCHPERTPVLRCGHPPQKWTLSSLHSHLTRTALSAMLEFRPLSTLCLVGTVPAMGSSVLRRVTGPLKGRPGGARRRAVTAMSPDASGRGPDHPTRKGDRPANAALRHA